NLPEKLIVAEGIETALSASAITGLPAVAAMNAANMKVVNLPNCREIIIAADNDANGVSQEAADELAQRLAAQGRTVRIALPQKADTDWNDVLKTGTDLAVAKDAILRAERFKGTPQVRALTMQEIIELVVPPREHLLQPWLEIRSLGMIFAY